MASVVGWARKNRWETLWQSSMVATTAAAPAVKATWRSLGRLSKALAELMVEPTTWRSDNMWSDRLGLLGMGLRGPDLLKGELAGVRRKAGFITV